MKKLLAVLLCAFLMFSGFVACSNSDAKDGENAEKENQGISNSDLVVGKWEADVDMTEMMEEIFASDEEMGEFITVSDFMMKFYFTFNSNSLMTLDVDEETLSASFDAFFAGIKEGMHDYFESMIEASELDMTVEELLAKSNLDLDTLVGEMSNAAIEAMKIDEMSYECYYEVSGDKLYSYDTVGERDENNYIEIAFPDENTMKFVNVNTEDTENILNMISELKKVNE